MRTLYGAVLTSLLALVLIFISLAFGFAHFGAPIEQKWAEVTPTDINAYIKENCRNISADHFNTSKANCWYLIRARGIEKFWFWSTLSIFLATVILLFGTQSRKFFVTAGVAVTHGLDGLLLLTTSSVVIFSSHVLERSFLEEYEEQQPSNIEETTDESIKSSREKRRDSIYNSGSTGKISAGIAGLAAGLVLLVVSFRFLELAYYSWVQHRELARLKIQQEIPPIARQGQERPSTSQSQIPGTSKITKENKSTPKPEGSQILNNKMQLKTILEEPEKESSQTVSLSQLYRTPQEGSSKFL